MRILYVTNDLPWPLTSGYLRHYHLIRQLSADHRITLLSLLTHDHGADDLAALQPYAESILTAEAAVRGADGAAGRLSGRLRRLARGGDPAAVELGRQAAELHARAPFDVVVHSGKRTWPIVRAVPDVPVVGDLCDATSVRIRRQLRHARAARRLPLALAWLEVRRVELAVLRRARSVLFASARDRDDLLGRDAGVATPGPSKRPPAAVVPNGVDLDYWRRERRTLGRRRIVLTGAMDYPPNADAAALLVEEILPLVAREVPDAEVAIVGRDPTPAVQRLAERPGVTVTGFVDDVRPWLEDAAVFAVPIRFGAGIQNKVLEAMAMEVPVVASPLAADGLRTEDDRWPPIEVATEPVDAAARLVARLRAADAPDGAPAEAALREYVAAHFDWARSGARLGELLAEAVEAPAGRPAAEGAR